MKLLLVTVGLLFFLMICLFLIALKYRGHSQNKVLQKFSFLKTSRYEQNSQRLKVMSAPAKEKLFGGLNETSSIFYTSGERKHFEFFNFRSFVEVVDHDSDLGTAKYKDYSFDGLILQVYSESFSKESFSMVSMKSYFFKKKRIHWFKHGLIVLALLVVLFLFFFRPSTQPLAERLIFLTVFLVFALGFAYSISVNVKETPSLQDLLASESLFSQKFRSYNVTSSADLNLVSADLKPWIKLAIQNQASFVSLDQGWLVLAFEDKTALDYDLKQTLKSLTTGSFDLKYNYSFLESVLKVFQETR